MARNSVKPNMIAAALLLTHLWAFILPDFVRAQTAECEYDKRTPALDSARMNFQVFNFHCAEMEILDLLKVDTVGLETKASAHMLLAAVYYEMLQDDAQRRSKILDQFKAAFKSYRDWRGQLDIQSPEFRSLMEEARRELDAAAPKPEPPKAPSPETPVVTQPPVVANEETGGGGSKKWLLIALGAGAVGVAVLALGGGGSKPAPPDETLPGFPPHPGGKKR